MLSWISDDLDGGFEKCCFKTDGYILSHLSGSIFSEALSFCGMGYGLMSDGGYDMEMKW